jgi:hypothetical protein
LIVIIAVGLPLLIFSFLMFDRAVKAEYANDRLFLAQWRRKKVHSGTFQKNPLGLRWLFSTPSWMMASPECQIWLRRFRICILAWNILVVIAFLTMASH